MAIFRRYAAMFRVGTSFIFSSAFFYILSLAMTVKSTLSKALDYIENPDKTDGKMLISSFGCSYETADIEFGYTLSQALDKGNNLAFHLIQSFAPGEVDYEKAHEIGKQLADAVTKGQHEYVVTTHIDNHDFRGCHPEGAQTQGNLF